nr:uncharacterized protein LOC116425174 isoform X1 [Nomia melanderi]
MFMFPEPPPIGYYIADVSPSCLSDGIFHRGKPAATHKHVAKQLRPIKRSLSDPVAPVQDIDPRVLGQWIKRENEGLVDPPGLDNGTVFETLSLMPKHVHQSSKHISSSIFPRSQQFELWHIRDRRSRNARKLMATMTECPVKHETGKSATNGEACDYLTPPFWWGGETARSAGFPVGDINEYAYEKFKESEKDDGKISEMLRMDHPKKYIPGVIHRMKNPEDRSMKEVLAKADAFKVVPKIEESSKDRSSVEEYACSTKKLRTYTNPSTFQTRLFNSMYTIYYAAVASVPRDTARKEEARRADKSLFDNDTRWQLAYEEIGFAGTDPERQRELQLLTKPFLHELHKWYSKSKPTKFAEPVKRKGKRPIPEMRFSHL